MLTVVTFAMLALSVDTVNMSKPAASARAGYHHGNLREALVDAALALARTGGPDAVVLRAVSREAGVSHNAAYRHFADHQDLLGLVSERCMDELAALMNRHIARVRTRNPVERAWARLSATGRAYIDFARSEPGWFRTAFSAAHPSPTEEAEPVEGPYGILAARLDELVEVGALPASRRPNAEYAAWSMVHGLSSLLVEGPLGAIPEPEVARAVDTVLAVVRRGL
jgi:AcrR family transcriptional regulator